MLGPGAVSVGPPLAHLRVLDLTDLRGALAGRMLADLGADVLHVEPPGGDPERERPPVAMDGLAAGESLAFHYRHANKRGSTLDSQPGDERTRLATLCDAVDILVENLSAAERVRLGLAPEAVRERHPRLVHVVVADCGMTGPRAQWRLEPLPALAASGALFASGPADRPPCGVPGFLAHDCAAAVAVVGALAAVLERARTGLGQLVEVSVEEAALALLAPWAIPLVDYARRYPVLPAELGRDGDGPAVVVPTADGWIRLLAITPRQLRGLGRMLLGGEGRLPVEGPVPDTPLPPSPTGRLSVAGGVSAVVARGASLLARLPLRGAGILPLYGLLSLVRRAATRAFARRSRDDLIAMAQRLRVPVAPVLTPREFVTAEQTRARGFFLPSPPSLPGRPFAVFPCRFSHTGVALHRGAPPRGANESPPAGGSSAEPIGEGRSPRGLTGLRVVDLGVGAVVPEMCRQLAELGADVVKLEPVEGRDFLRRIEVDPVSPNRSWMFNDTARGRRSVALDLRSEDGRTLARRLCAAADVVAENRTAGVVERWGLGYDAIRDLRPDVVYVSSQGFGRGGPLGQAGGYGPLAAAFAGVTWLWSHPDVPRPVGTSLEHPDHYAARLLAVAVLAALEHRERTGEGQYIELAQTEAAAFPMGEQYFPDHPELRGNAAVHACPHGVYPASGVDRWLAISVDGDAAFERFRRCLGWPDDPALATLAGRLARRPDIEERVAVWTRTRDAMAAAVKLQAAGISAMPVQGPCALLSDHHLAARRAFVTVSDPEIGPVRHVGSALRMSATPVGPVGSAPKLGEHTAAVLAEWLGVRADEVVVRRAG